MIRASHSLVYVSALLAVAGCATSVGPEDDEARRIRFGDAPGELVVDARTNPVFDAPGEGRRFATEEDMFLHLMETWGAEPVYGDDGVIESVRGTMVEMDHALYEDPSTGELRRLYDPVAADLGGLAGYVHIGDEAYCVRPEVCGDNASGELTLLSLPSDASDCDYGDRFCIESEAFRTNYWVYKSIGTEVKNTKGGFVDGRNLRCVRDHRTDPPTVTCDKPNNTLEITNYYQLGREWGWGVHEERRSANQVESLTLKHWIAGIGNKPNVCSVIDSAVCEIEGVCGHHSGRGDSRLNEGAAETGVGKGDQFSGHCGDVLYPF